MASADTALPSGDAADGLAIGAKENRVIWLLLAAAFVAILNETTMGVAIPHLIEDLQITALAAQWLTTAFMLTMAVVIPTTGFLLQRFSTRAMFTTAMALFSFGTLIALAAPGFATLLLGRIVQASGTAIMMPLLMTTLMTVVPVHARGRMMGRVSIVMSLAPAIGPTMAGIVLDNLSWRWIFGIVLPIAVVALVVGARWIHNLGERSHAPIDILSVVLSAFGFGGLVFGLSQIGAGGQGDVTAAMSILVGALVGGGVALLFFLWRQVVLQRRDDALLDLRIFRSANFSLSVGHFTLMSLAFFGSLTVLPLFLQGPLGLSTTESGLVVLPGAVAMALLGPAIGRIYDHWGTRVLLVPGTLVVIAVLWWFSTLTESTPVWLLIVAQTAFSVGLAMSFTPLFTASLGSLEPHYYSYGSAAVSTVQQVAGAAGVAMLISVMSSVSASATGVTEIAAAAAGARAAFLLAATASLPLLVSAFLIRKPADGSPGAVAHAH
ncbi:MAG: DHA2 family efflux MFS transporter permease subunit [Microbacterium sp.]